MKIDVLKYKPVIDRVLAKLKVKPPQKPDMVQECYVALLEKQRHLQHGEENDRSEEVATSICTTRVLDVWRKENQYRPGSHKTKPDVRIDSLSDPRIYQKAAKVASPVSGSGGDASSWELRDALLSLPFEEYRVLYEVYVEDKTQAETATNLSLTVDQVRTRKDRGVEMLKKYFEVEKWD